MCNSFTNDDKNTRTAKRMMYHYTEKETPIYLLISAERNQKKDEYAN